MAQRLKCIIVNETEFALTPTLNNKTELNFKLIHGTFENVAQPPCPIATGASGEFAVTSDGATPGIDGWACYELPIGTVVQIMWRDPAAGDDGCKMGLNAYIDNARKAEITPVAFSDSSGNPLSATEAKTADDVVATYRVRLKPDANTAAAAPAPKPAINATPDSDTPVNGHPPYRTLDDPRLANEPKRKRVLAIVGNEFPMSDKHSGSPAPYGQGKYKSMKSYWDTSDPNFKAIGTSCTAVPGHIKALCGATGGGKWLFDIAELTTSDGWVPFETGKWPSVGDLYILYHDRMEDVSPSDPDETKKMCHEHHVGFICHVPKDTNEIWVTADGGQGDVATGQSAELVPRPWEWFVPKYYTGSGRAGDPKTHEFAKPIPGMKYPYFGGGAEGLTGAKRLLGWLDMSHASITFKKLDLDDGKKGLPMYLYTQSDYDELVRGVKIVAAYKK